MAGYNETYQTGLLWQFSLPVLVLKLLTQSHKRIWVGFQALK